MKKIYIISAILGLALVSCNEKALTDEEILNSRPATDLEVSYSSEGSEIESVAFTSKAAVRTIDVSLNNEHLKWNVESDRNWCVVRSEEHQGSGSFTLEIAANEDFEARDAATLTFVAGAFRGFKIRVTQNGSAFIISQPYFVAGKEGGSFAVDITTPESVEWEIEENDWLSPSIGSSEVADGYATTHLTLSVADNEGDTRYGILRLNSLDGETDQIAVAQFGTDLSYEDHAIFFPGEGSAVLTFLAPEFVIGQFNVPDYATAEMTPNGDGTVTVTVTLTENFSDCSEMRLSDISMTLTNASYSTVALPPVLQGYVAAHGLVTAAGVQRFAQAVALGEPTTDWETDGVVMLRGDIDMSDVTLWEGVGTEEHPFTGKFNGDGHSIQNLKKAKGGFFHNCKDASVSNLVIGTGSTIYLSGSFEEQAAYGGIADKAENSTFSGCTYSGAFEFAQTSTGDAYIGGILGEGDAATRVLNCRTDGTITLSSASTTLTVYAGGIAGEAGTVSRNEFSGEIKCLTGAICRIAGIIPSLGENNKVTDNSFLGTLTLNGSSVNMKVGGLYAEIEGPRTFDEASDKSVVSGTIDIVKFGTASTARHFVGGMVGYIGSDASLNIAGYTSLTNIKLNYSEARTAMYLCIGGFLGGCDLDNPASSIAMDGVTNQGTVSINYSTSSAISVRRTCVGGMAGLLNGPATFKNCVNQAELGAKTGGDYSGKSNAYSVIMGGIAGLGFGGNMEFEKCSNLFPLTNNFYSNHWLESYSSELRTALATGGMIGAFNYNKTFQEMHLKISNCTARGNLTAYRGFIGGMVGFAYDAEISNCSWEGNSVWKSDAKDNQASYKGGIAGVLGKGSISGCTVRGDIYASMAGSATSADGGGILARAYGSEDVTVSGCSYYGNMESRSTTSTPVVSQLGGIVGCATEQTTVSSCKFGGSIKSVPISENNLSEMVVGAGTPASVTEITYWNGN
jgi:hypothetical protein